MPTLEMAWKDVLVASYPVPPDAVAPQLPDDVEVDTVDGDAYLSAVPLVIEDIRPRGVPAALGLTTPELNLRTPVTCDGVPGVYFFSLDAEDPLAVLAARLWNALPYYYAAMTYEAGDRIRFESRRRTPGARPLAFAATYGPDGDPYRADAGTLEHFLVERYRYFTEDRAGRIHSAAVEHEPWTLRPATWVVATNDLFRANGFEDPDGDPVLLYGDRLDVTASPSERWRVG